MTKTYRDGLERATEICDGVYAEAKPFCEREYTDGDAWVQTCANLIRAEIAKLPEVSVGGETQRIQRFPQGLVNPELCSVLLSDLDKLERELSVKSAEIEQLRVQLAGCGVAAWGGTKDPAKIGDFGWSPTYEDTLNLRRKYDALLAHQQNAAGDFDPYSSANTVEHPDKPAAQSAQPSSGRAIRSALIDLVRLKDLKEWIEAGLPGVSEQDRLNAKARYEQEKEPAWEAARLALEAYVATLGKEKP